MEFGSCYADGDQIVVSLSTKADKIGHPFSN